MGCCGKGKRPRPYIPGYGFKMVRWQGQGPIKVHGGVTGKTYRFEGYGSVVPIDDRDMGNVSVIHNMVVVGQ